MPTGLPAAHARPGLGDFIEQCSDFGKRRGIGAEAGIDHPLPRACEVAVNFQDYHRSSSKLGRFGKVIGIDEEAAEYLIMLDNFESVSVPMHRVEWRKRGT